MGFVKFILFFSTLISILISCSSKVENALDSDVLSKEKMVEILTETQLIEGALHKKLLGGENQESTAGHLYLSVLKNHKVSKELFEKSYEFYIQDPDEVDWIYQNVINNLSVRKSELQAEADRLHPRK